MLSVLMHINYINLKLKDFVMFLDACVLFCLGQGRDRRRNGPCVLLCLGARTRSMGEWAVCSVLLGGKDEIDGGMGRVFYSTWGQG